MLIDNEAEEPNNTPEEVPEEIPPEEVPEEGGEEGIDEPEVDDPENPEEGEEVDEGDKGKSKDTVSLKKHLKLKKKNKELQKELDKKGKTGEKKDESKKPDLTEDNNKFVERLKKEEKQDKFDTAFGAEFDKLLANYPELAGKKEIVKTLSTSDKYKDSELEDIALDAFSDLITKRTSEDAEGSGGEKDNINVDFNNMTGAQTEAVMKDPVAKEKYYKHLDKQ